MSFEGGAKKEKQLKTRGNAPLRAALAMMGLVAVADPGVTESRTSVLTEPKLIRATDHQKSLEFALRLEKKILSLQRKLAVGGEYDRELRSDSISESRFAEIIDEMSHASASLTRVRSGLIQATPFLSHITAFPQRNGRASLFFRDKKNPEKRNRCQGVYLTVGNYSYIGTNEHCIRGTTEEDHFLAIPELADIALKRLNHGLKNVDSHALLESTTDESIQGKAVILDSVNRFDQREAFTTFLFPITKHTLTMLFKFKPTPEMVRQYVGGFAFVMPPDLGNEGVDGRGAAFKGLSGSHLLEPGMDGNHSIAAIFHTGMVRLGSCLNTTVGTCTTIGFAHTPDTIRHMTQVYDILKPRGEKLSNR